MPSRMGDARFDAPLRALQESTDPAGALHDLPDEDVISALAASARKGDPYLANVLATEAHNRVLRMRAITDSMSEGVMVATADGRMVYVNPAAERMFGLDLAAFRSEGAEARLHVSPEAHAQYQRVLTEQMRAQGVARIEHEMRRADGTRFWTEQSLTVLRNAAGEESGWVLLVRDVTEPHRLQEDLRRALDMHEAMLSSTPAVILIVDRDFRIVRANRAFTAVTGLPEDAVVGRPLADAVPIPADNEAAMRDALETGLVFEATDEPDAAGERLWDWSAVPLRRGEGNAWGLLIVAVDATERRDAQRRFVRHPAPATRSEDSYMMP